MQPARLEDDCTTGEMTYNLLKAALMHTRNKQVVAACFLDFQKTEGASWQDLPGTSLQPSVSSPGMSFTTEPRVKTHALIPASPVQGSSITGPSNISPGSANDPSPPSPKAQQQIRDPWQQSLVATGPSTTSSGYSSILPESNEGAVSGHTSTWVPQEVSERNSQVCKDVMME